MADNLYTKGWYCWEHRRPIRCSACGVNYYCAICANPHACYHVRDTPFLRRLHFKNLSLWRNC
ncbi:hypothetical protein F5Y04DRAFT_262716 [Hypomontagnella monticulosa]|nr:hypothetical protein F5Y04DRAFT_262716 [Hypomontagnella monticulosa]